MTTITIGIRKAELDDAEAIADVHHAAWQGAYAGIIPHRSLTNMLQRRGAGWWANAIRRAASVLVIEVGGEVAGYATIGRNRSREPYSRPGSPKFRISSTAALRFPCHIGSA